MSTTTDEKVLPAWIGRLECGCVVAMSIAGEDDFVFSDDPDIVTVEETTVEQARGMLTFDHSRPTCEIIAERDSARSIAASLEAELALKDEALREILAEHGGCDITECRVALILTMLEKRITEAENRYDQESVDK